MSNWIMACVSGWKVSVDSSAIRHAYVATGCARLGGGNHGQLYLRTCFRQEGETCFRTRFPAEPTETLAHGFFTKAKPAGNPTIAHLLGFEAEDDAVSLMEFLVHGRTAYWPSPRSRESAQSTGFERLVVG
jgi:hypothetical protein